MLRCLTVAAFVLLGSLSASGKDWPMRPVRFVVPYPAGGGTDIIARVLAQKLSDGFGQPFMVENKPGATGALAAQTVVKDSPNGYVFLVATPNEVALNPHLIPDLGYEPLIDLAPVTLLAWTPFVLAAHPSLSASNLTELIDLARSQPLNFSIPGVGSAHHLVGEYINKLQSTQLVYVAYRGAAPAVSDTVSGHVKFTIAGMPPAMEFLRSGQLKAIAVSSRRRSPALPDAPAMAETRGFEDFDFTNWFGLMARTGTAPSILSALSDGAAVALRDPKLRAVLETQAAVPIGNTPAEFAEFIRSESEKYAKVIRMTGIKAK